MRRQFLELAACRDAKPKQPVDKMLVLLRQTWGVESTVKVRYTEGVLVWFLHETAYTIC
jgi:hypothetical protein